MIDPLTDPVEIATPKILIVDDRPENLLALEKLLADLPVELVRAGSGNEALALTLEYDFALGLIDVQMPDMDGFETVELMRQQEVERLFPVIFVSAVYSGDFYKVKGVEVGAIDFIEKPIVPEILIGKVNQFLEINRYKETLKQVNVQLEKQVRQRTELLEQANAKLKTEVSERTRAEEHLRKSLESLETVQEVTQIGFYERNLQSGISIWSKGIYSLFNISPKEVSPGPKNFMELVHPEDRRDFNDAFRAAEVNGGKLNIDFRSNDQGDEVRYMRLLGNTNLDASGKAFLHHGIIQDISDRKRAERERLDFQAKLQHAQKLESLGVLAGGIAHDFNNLLMSILGNADLAMMKVAPGSAEHGNVNEVIIAAKRASELCSQMLAYSGKGHFVVESIDMAVIAREITELISVAISKKAEIIYSFTADVPPIMADAAQISQIIMNLITNASEAIGDQKGTISIATGVIEGRRAFLDKISPDLDLQEGAYSYIEVADTGCGMDQDVLDSLYDPFFSTKFTGRGLGLSAVLGIVRGHGGAIECTSEPGAGTTFRVYFPAAVPSEVETAEVKKSNSPPDKTVEGTVLVVDDEEMICDIATDMFAMMGLDVLIAQDGQIAVDIFKKEASKLVCVLLDLTMPNMGGEECLRQLREINKEIPVLISSGYSAAELVQRFTDDPCIGFIQKPYAYTDLEVALKKVVGPGS